MRGDLRWPRGPFQVHCVLVAALLTAASLQLGSAGQGDARPLPDKASLDGLGERLNANTIAIVSGNADVTGAAIVNDLCSVLDDGENLRILPVVGKDGAQDIRDVRFLKGVDLGITQSVLLNALQQTRELGNLGDQVAYLGKLFNEEMHVFVRADSGITSIEQLAGKKVNFGDAVARQVFQELGIRPAELGLAQAEALEELKSGDIAANVLMIGKPAASIAKLAGAGAGLRLLPVPFAKQLRNDYLPSSLGHDDYPALVEAGHSVDTIAVSTVLIAYNAPADSDRYRRIAKFVNAFFAKLGDLQKPPHHPKWRETNLAAVLPGWTRFAAAEDWLKRHREPKPNPAYTRDLFEQFLAIRRASGADMDSAGAGGREQLFQEFLKWQAREGH